ncbi:MAG: Calx-beta domain-containing protein [Bacteroidota bacterium]
MSAQIIEFGFPQTVSEDVGTVQVQVFISSPADCSADVIMSGSSTASPDDISFTFPFTVNFTAGGPTIFDVFIPIVDDPDIEPDETLALSLTSVSGGCNLGASTTFIVIEDNDTPGPPMDLMLVGGFDGPATSYRALEFFVINDIPDLSIYGFGVANFGGGTDGQEYIFPPDAATAGQCIIVGRDSALFNQYFGFDATYIDPQAGTMQGGDAIEVYKNGVVGDIFGDPDMSGLGTAWDYRDGWFYRKNFEVHSINFDVDDWNYSGTNVTDGTTDNATAPVPYPHCTYQPLPPPADLIIAGGFEGFGTSPRALVFYATNDIPSLGVYEIALATNGAPMASSVYTFPAGMSALAGDCIIVANDSTDFNNFFGVDADLFSVSAVGFNGDDVIQLWQGGAPIDVFGELGMDGSGTFWEYTNGWFYRLNTAVLGSLIFDLDDWVFSEPNVVENTNQTNDSLSYPFPLCLYDASDPIPVVNFVETAIDAVEEDALVSLGVTISTFGDCLLDVICNPIEALSGSDYSCTSEPILFGEGQPFLLDFFSADIIDDMVEEMTETFKVELAINDGEGCVLGPDSVAIITIIDDDAPPRISFSDPFNYSVDEDEGIVEVSLEITELSNCSVDVVLGTSSATNGPDFTFTDPTTVTFTELTGQTEMLNIPIIDDLDIESAEVIELLLSVPTGDCELGLANLATVTIMDNDTAVSAGFVDTTHDIIEDDGTLDIPISIQSPATCSLDVALLPGGTATPGLDYTYSGVLVSDFSGGNTQSIISIPITDDMTPEGTETFQLVIQDNGSGCEPGQDSITTVSIIDNDTVPANLMLVGGIDKFSFKMLEFYVLADIPDLSIYGFGIADDGGGSNGVQYTFPSVQANEGQCITITEDSVFFQNYFGNSPDFTSSVLANMDGIDAVELFSMGMRIDVFGDPNISGSMASWNYEDGWFYRKNNISEPSANYMDTEWFVIPSVQFGDSNLESSNAYPMCLFSPANPTPEVSLSSDNYTFYEDNGTVSVNLTISAIADCQVVANLIPGTALLGSDYDTISLNSNIVTFSAANPSASEQFEFIILDDQIPELVENLTIVISSPSPGCDLGEITVANVTIIDNDGPEINLGNSELGEFAPDTLAVSELTGFRDFEVILSESADCSVDVVLVESEAIEDEDYNFNSPETVSFFSGSDITQVIVVPIINDIEMESVELMKFALRNVSPSCFIGSDSLIYVEIIDDDTPNLEINTATTTISVPEDVGSFDFQLTLPFAADCTINIVSSNSSTATEGLDYGSPLQSTVDFTADGPTEQSLTIDILDDSDVEITETIKFALSTDSPGCQIGGITEITVLILDDDQPAITMSDLVISGGMVGPFGDLVFLEFYNSEMIPSLAEFGFGISNDGEGDVGSEYTFPDVMVPEGSCIVVTNDTSEFNDFMINASVDFIFEMPVDHDGNDAIQLFFQSQQIDVYGIINQDGAGTFWDYNQGWFSRISGNGPDGHNFTPDGWEISGPNATEFALNSTELVVPYPLCNYTENLAGLTVANFDAPVVREMDEDDGTFFGRINFSEPVDQDGTIELSIDPESTATEGEDFIFPEPIEVDFEMGDESVTFEFPVLNDLDDEPDEQLTLLFEMFSDFQSSTLPVAGPLNALQIRINDDDQPAGPSGLLISGVVDGPLSGGTKAIELYALTDIPDLSHYGIGSANNGDGTDGEEFTFPAISVAAGECIYVTNNLSNFSAFFGFEADFEDGAANVNGDDAIELFFNDSVVDVFGEIFVDGTGEPWEYLDGWAYRKNGTGPDGSTFTNDNWIFSGVNILDNETMNSTALVPFPTCLYSPVPADGPEITFTMVSQTVDEAVGSIDVEVMITETANCSVDLAVGFTSSATEGMDFSFTSPTTISFTDGGPTTMMVNVPIIDDSDVEGLEFIAFVLQNPTGSGGCDIGAIPGSTVLIEDNDVASVNIIDIHGEEADGSASSDGDMVQISGVVHCIDFDSNEGYDFYIHDGTAGINVFEFSDVDAYQAMEGDEITITGEVDQFRGLTEIRPETIQLISTGNPLVPNTVVTVLDESTESVPVTINAVSLLDPNQWTTGMGGFGFIVDVTDGSNMFEVFIDSDVELYNLPFPNSAFNLSGIGSQRTDDTSPPFDSGYRIIPCSLDDLDLIISIETPSWSERIEISPNPAWDFLDVNLNDADLDIISIFNLYGQKLDAVINPANNERFNLAMYSSGIYFIHFQNEEGAYSIKFVKE